MDDWIARKALTVVPRERVRSLSERSDRKGWIQTGGHVAAIAATTMAIVAVPVGAPALWAPLLLIQGVLLNCLYAGQHELSHWTVFRTKRLNDLFGHLFGFATLNPFLGDRWAHFAHHRATHDPERDSELMGMPHYTTATYLLDLSGVTFWGRRVRSIVRTAAGLGLTDAYWLTPEQAPIVVREARITVGLWGVILAASLATGSWAAFVFWLGPLLVTKAFHQLQNTGEHTGMPHTPDIFRNTRTLRGPAPMRWLLWNMSYHTAHHCFPGVPFHALPALHDDIVAGLDHPVTTLGYIEAQRAILAGLRAGRAGALA